MNEFLKRIAAKFHPTFRQDPIFGSMRFMGEKLGYWEAKGLFPPTGASVEFFVDGTEDDSFEIQHEFMEFITTEWKTIASAIAPKLKEIWETVNQKAMSQEIWKEFVLNSISVPESTTPQAEWNLSFLSRSNEGLSFWVEMKGREPETVSYDS